METWALEQLATVGRPLVLDSRGARVVLIRLDADEELGEHQVKEDAWIVVVDGEIELVSETGSTVCAPAGTLAFFERRSRRVVRATGGATFLLFLAPWPAPDHDGTATPSVVVGHA